LRTLGARVVAELADVRQYEALQAALAKCRQELGPVDVLVCGAAGNFPIQAEKLSPNGFKSVIDIDLLGSFNACRGGIRSARHYARLHHFYLRWDVLPALSVSGAELRRCEARVAEVSDRQCAAHQALCLPGGSPLSQQRHQGGSRRAAPGLAQCQGAGQAVHVRQYVVARISVRSSNAYAVISPARPLPTSGSSAIQRAKSCCSSKSPYRDGATHIVMSPLELLQRLAALVPRPRLHMIRFHGVLAPHAKLRAVIVARPALEMWYCAIAKANASDPCAALLVCAASRR